MLKTVLALSDQSAAFPFMVEFLAALRHALDREIALTGHLVPLGPDDDRRDPSAPETVSFAQAEAPALAAAASSTDAVEIPSSVDVSTPDDGSSDMANMDLFGNELDASEDPSLPPAERIASLIPDDSPLHAMTSLEEVEAYTNATELIPLDAQRQNAVFGVGNPTADLVVIGEAPGADEDRTGEPFVGRAGQLLDKILSAINFSREEIYITNILKSRPPNNRDPLVEEVEAHVPLLYKQLALIQPKVLLCVGKTAGNTLLDRRSSLSSLRGSFHDFYGIPTMVTYHPAALLRNAQWKRPTWEDVQLLRTRYDQLVDA